MHANSREVESTQQAPHPRLQEIVARHRLADFRREPSSAGCAAFARVAAQLARAPFILDAGCGTGASTLALAELHPEHVVIGVDKSAARLASGLRMLARYNLPNILLLQIDLVDFWQLAAQADLRCTKQYLLYPNPWPKPEHLKRRWHAHPALPSLLRLGRTIELRTNWKIYADEFAQAMRCHGLVPQTQILEVTQPLTPFERKYADSGHALWRCITA